MEGSLSKCGHRLDELSQVRYLTERENALVSKKMQEMLSRDVNYVASLLIAYHDDDISCRESINTIVDTAAALVADSYDWFDAVTGDCDECKNNCG